MNKSDIVKLRIEPQRKEVWKEYAENCLVPLTLSQLVIIATDYFVSGQYYRDTNGSHKSLYTDSFKYPHITKEVEYLKKFTRDAKIETQASREKKEKFFNEM